MPKAYRGRIFDFCPSFCAAWLKLAVTTIVILGKFFSDLTENWYVCKGRWVMHDGMQQHPIQGQGNKPLKVGNSTIFEGYLFHL